MSCLTEVRLRSRCRFIPRRRLLRSTASPENNGLLNANVTALGLPMESEGGNPGNGLVLDPAHSPTSRSPVVPSLAREGDANPAHSPRT
jgi:hypothetical protein